MSPVSFFVYVMVKTEKTHYDQKTSRQWAVLTGRRLCRIPPRPGVHCYTQTGGSWEPSSWWGSLRRQQRQIQSSDPPFPLKHTIAKLNFKPRAAIFHSPSLEKVCETTLGPKPKLVFCCFSWSTRETIPEFQMWGSWMDVCVQASAQQLQSWRLPDSCEKPPLTTFFSFSTWTSDLLVWKERGRKKKSWHSLFCFLNFVNWLMIKRMSFSSISILQNRKIENL